MTIPLPQKGQPIDQNYIYQIADTINHINDQMATQMSTVDTDTNSTTNQITSTLIFSARQVPISSVNSSTSKTVTTTTTDLRAVFKYPPIVTITPYATDGALDKDMTIVIQNVTTTSVTFMARFSSNSGRKNIVANILAIGIPN
jgi:hypothetical protein